MYVIWTGLAAFTIGLLGSGHCIGMCGGIAAILTPEQMSARDKLSNIFLYNFGRIVSYSIAGLIAAGATGYLVTKTVDTAYWSELLRTLTGIIMAIIGLCLITRNQFFKVFERIGYPIWLTVSPLSRRLRPASSSSRWLLLGMVWGWLPCGMVYSVLIMAGTSAEPIHGMLIMFAFGLGTLPALICSGVFFAKLDQWRRRIQISRYAGALCVLIGVWTAAAPQLSFHSHNHHTASNNADASVLRHKH